MVHSAMINSAVIKDVEENARALKAINDKMPEGISMLENFKKCFGYVGEAERKKFVLRKVEEFHYTSFATDQIRRSVYAMRRPDDTAIYSDIYNVPTAEPTS